MSRRKYLTMPEVNRIINALYSTRFHIRNQCLIYMAYIHGLRVSELITLRMSDIDLGAGIIYVHRLKNGYSTQHPITAGERGLLERWLILRQQWLSSSEDEGNDWLFITQKCTVLSRQQVYHIIRKGGLQAGVPVKVHPHMLRHACGYFLAGCGADTRLIQDYLGHQNIRHTVLYTAGCASRFNNLWLSESMFIK